MKKTPAMLVLVCALALPGPALADEFGDMFGIMFRMMLTMMNVMSDVAGDSNAWGGNGNSFGSGFGGWPAMGGMSGLGAWPAMAGMSGMGAWPMTGGWPGAMGGWPLGSFTGSPWSVPFAGNQGASPFSGAGYGFPANQVWPGGPGGSGRYPGAYPAISLLEGKWYGQSGEILEIHGKRFVLRDGVQAIKGAVNVDNNLVHLFSPQTGTVTSYTFVRNESELMMQGPSGETLVFYKRPYGAAYPLRVF